MVMAEEKDELFKYLLRERGGRWGVKEGMKGDGIWKMALRLLYSSLGAAGIIMQAARTWHALDPGKSSVKLYAMSAQLTIIMPT
jgi:hypothetical protein